MRTRIAAVCIPAVLCAALLLAGCGGDSEASESASGATASGATKSGAESTTADVASTAATSAVPLSAGDQRTCADFIAEQGDTYAALTRYRDTGTSSGPELGSVYNIGGFAQHWTSVATNADLITGLQTLVDFQAQTRAEIDAGTFRPTRHIAVLDYAADLCEAGGSPIAWN